MQVGALRLRSEPVLNAVEGAGCMEISVLIDVSAKSTLSEAERARHDIDEYEAKPNGLRMTDR
jgi:hypothetical protein